MEDETVERLETQFILRLPMATAEKLRAILPKTKKVKKHVSITLNPEQRTGEFQLKSTKIPMVLVDFPTIIESLKTTNNWAFYKTADISQMLMPADYKTAYKKMADTYKWPHGLSPSLKNVRTSRFRKSILKKHDDEEFAIEREIFFLFRADREAVRVRWEIIEDETTTKDVDKISQSQQVFGDLSTTDTESEDEISK